MGRIRICFFSTDQDIVASKQNIAQASLLDFGFPFIFAYPGMSFQSDPKRGLYIDKLSAVMTLART